MNKWMSKKNGWKVVGGRKVWDVKHKELCPWITSVCSASLTWNIAYMMHVRGRLCEYPATLKMLRPHLFRSSSSCNQNERDLRITVLLFLKALKHFERFYLGEIGG